MSAPKPPPPPKKAAGKEGVKDVPAAKPAAAKPAAATLPRDDTGPLPDLVGNTNFPGTEKLKGKEKYYVTTAISYTNGLPHIGHAYEALTADVLARWHRVFGRRTYFLTGTDEHGQKIAKTAEAQGIQPIDICNKYSSEFIKLNRRLLVSNDRFIRTTEAQHKRTCQELWTRCAANGDIYKDNYKGWYLEREETFVAPKDAEEWGYKDPQTGVPLKEMDEESYFFKLSKYREPLLKLLQDQPGVCLPEERRQQIVAMLESEQALNDLSISRTSFAWGIPVPEGFDQKHVMYVWFDALTNYMSGVHGLDGAANSQLSDLWPADAHIIGKDIIRFHCIYWPAMLLSAGLPLPKAVFSHGFVNSGDGRKMSKSFGNVIDPHAMLDKYPPDTLRFYMCSEADRKGGDVKFSEEELVRAHNGPLADTLGNLVHRATNLAKKYCDGKVPDVTTGELAAAYAGVVSASERPLDVSPLVKAVDKFFTDFDIMGAREITFEAARNVNNWLAKLEPWKMKEGQAALRVAVVRAALEAVFVLAHLLAPLLPLAATEMLHRLGAPARPVSKLSAGYDNLPAKALVTVGEPLFPKLLEPGAAEPSNAAGGGKAAVPVGKDGKPMSANAQAAAAGKAAKEAKKKALKEEQAKRKAEKQAAEAAGAAGAGAAGGVPDVCLLDIRVGKIVKAWEHPESDKLWCESIDVGEGKERSICSGLRAFYASAKDLEGKLVLVLANLKARKMAGFSSEGMVLCASSPAHDVVKLVEPPAGAKVGDRVTFEGLPESEPASPAQMAKKKIPDTVVFGGQLVTVMKGGVTVGAFKGENAMVVASCHGSGKGHVTAPVPAGYTVA